MLFTSLSTCSKLGRNRPKTTYSNFRWGALISAEPEQDQDLLPVLGVQRGLGTASSQLMLTPVPGCGGGRDRSHAVAEVGEPAPLSPHTLPAVMPCWGLDPEQERCGNEPSSSRTAKATPDAIPRIRDALRR